MDHADHEPGTMEECPGCRALAVEAGWYKVLREEQVVARGDEPVLVPEAGEPDVDVVVAEAPAEIPARIDVEEGDDERAHGTAGRGAGRHARRGAGRGGSAPR